MFKPQLARNAELSDIKFPCIGQKKWDGERLIYYNNELIFRSLKKIGNEWVVKTLKDELVRFNIPLDGEVQVGRSFKNTSGFLNNSEREEVFVYHVFDTPLEGVKYRDRYKILVGEIERISSPFIKLIENVEISNPDQLNKFHYENTSNLSLDGTIIRNPESYYKYGEATIKNFEAIKIKEFEDDEGIIVGFTERMRNNNEAKKNELGRTFRSSSKKNKEGTGLIGSYTVSWNDLEFNVTATGDMQEREVKWINRNSDLGKLMKFKFQGIGAKGRPRFPTELGIRSKEDL